MRLLLLLVACAPSAQDIGVSAHKDLGDPTDHNFVPDGGTPDGDDGGGGAAVDGGSADAGGLPSGAFNVSTQGMSGGSVQVVALAPGLVYVGTDGAGVFKSSDNGDHFVPASVGLGAISVLNLVVDPVQPSSVWALASTNPDNTGAHAYHSSDGAASWAEVVPSPFPAVDSVDRIAAVGDTVYMVATRDVYHSADGGKSWIRFSNAIPLSEVPEAVAIDPSNLKTAYLLSNFHFYKTTDAGLDWPVAGIGLPNVPVGGGYQSLGVDPLNPATLYVGALGVGSGLFQSKDRGDHFTDKSASGFNCVSCFGSAMGFDPVTTSTLYTWGQSVGRGLMKGVNSGQSWTAVDLQLTTGTVQWFAAPSSSTLFTGWDTHGLRRSLDSGANWSDANTGISNVNIQSFAHAPSSPTTVYAGSRDGVIFKSTDGGRAWTATMGVDAAFSVVSLAVHPTDPNTVYAGCIGNFFVNNMRKGGVFKSIDGGTSWFALDLGQQQNMEVNQVLLDPQAATHVYAVGTSLIKSTDSGVSFSPLQANFAGTLVIDPQNSQTMYVLGGDQRSLDGGATFDVWHAGVLEPGGADLLDGISGLAIDPANDMRLYACTRVGLYISDNAGTTFSHAGVGFTSDSFCTFLALNGSTLYALSGDGKLFGSTDGATTWAPLAIDAFADQRLAALAVQPDDANTVLLGLNRSVGVLRTETGGR